MISYEVVIQQLEKQIVDAKSAKGEQQIREALTAVRALCDVVLAQPIRDQQPRIQEMTLNPVIQQVLTVDSIAPAANASKIKEDDGANGDSIFDF
ncbi:MAG: YwdI family protein [Lysinibacillus sp.]